MTVILTKRLLLVPCSGSLHDITQQVHWLNDPEVVKYSEQRHKRHTIQEQYNYIDSIRPPSLFRQIILANVPIGTINAYIDQHNNVADMGIMVGDKSAWGKGYGTEAWLGLMQHLFATGVRKVEAGCMLANKGMLSIFAKSGMHREGYRRNHFLLGDEVSDLEMWARFKNE